MAKTEELIMTCLAYETLFDDYLTIDIKSVASSIPYLGALDFIVKSIIIFITVWLTLKD